MKVEGLVGFSTSKTGFISKVIKFFRNSKWSHCYIVFGVIADEMVVGEAATFEIRMAPFRRFLDPDSEFELWYIKSLDPAKVDEAIRTAMMKVGQPYNYFQLLGFIWVWLAEKLKIKKQHNPFQGGYVCSSYAAYWLELSGYKGLDYTYLGDIAPDTVHLSFESDGTSHRIGVSPQGSTAMVWDFGCLKTTETTAA